jgi:hypothetical protein
MFQNNKNHQDKKVLKVSLQDHLEINRAHRTVLTINLGLTTPLHVSILAQSVHTIKPFI